MCKLFVIATAGLVLPMFVRGGTLHNHIVREAAILFGRAGFGVSLEHAVALEDGRTDFVDLLVWCRTWEFCVEVETSARNVLTNAAKAEMAGLPLWVIVPNRRVRQAVAARLATTSYHPGGLRIYILLAGELDQRLTHYFPLFSPANTPRENRKTKQIDGSKA